MRDWLYGGAVFVVAFGLLLTASVRGRRAARRREAALQRELDRRMAPVVQLDEYRERRREAGYGR